MITSTQIQDTESFALIAVLLFKLLSRKVLLINRKGNGHNLYKSIKHQPSGNVEQNFPIESKVTNNMEKSYSID